MPWNTHTTHALNLHWSIRNVQQWKRVGVVNDNAWEDEVQTCWRLTTWYSNTRDESGEWANGTWTFVLFFVGVNVTYPEFQQGKLHRAKRERERERVNVKTPGATHDLANYSQTEREIYLARLVALVPSDLHRPPTARVSSSETSVNFVKIT